MTPLCIVTPFQGDLLVNSDSEIYPLKISDREISLVITFLVSLLRAMLDQ